MRSTSPGAARALSLLATFVAASLVTGALIAGLFIPAVGATGVVTRSGVNYFNSLPADLSTPPLAEQSTMYAADGRTPIARFYDENRITVPLSKIAPVMRQAIIAIEDSRFYEHGGVDPKGVLRAVLNNQMSGNTQGASTLTQQYIKNYNVEKAIAAGDTTAARAAVSQNYARKLQEIRTAVALEKTKSKDAILEGYLNIALFGDNTWGIEAASQYYFSTSASQLTLVQAATLAGLVQSPSNYSPFTHPDHAITRRNEVLTRMFQLGMINQQQYQTARASKLVTKRKQPHNGCITAGNMAYFCEYVLNVLKRDPGFAFLGKTQTERETNIKRGGYKIVTSLEPKVQAQAWKTVTGHIPVTDSSHFATAAVTVQPGTGRVVAMAQNRIYSVTEGTGRTALNYGVDQRYGSSIGFATGSTFKPFTLATFLSEGNSLNDVVDASQTKRPFSDFTACGKSLPGWGYSGTYPFHNAGDGEGGGGMTVQQATYDSVNTAFVDIESRVDMCDLVTTAQKLGVHLSSVPSKQLCVTASGNGVTLDYKKNPLTLPYCQPSLTLGANSISPLTMAAGYAAFAADGKFCAPHPVLTVQNRAGKAMPVPAAACSRALDSDVAHGVTYALKKVLTQGTAAGQGIGLPAAGKTGTSDSSANTWFVGYTHSLSTAVWVADPNHYRPDSGRHILLTGQRDGLSIKIDGHWYGALYGGNLAASIWRDLMKQATKGRDNADWPDPPSSMLQGSGVRLPDVTGQSVAQASIVLTSAGFRVNVGGFVRGSAPAGTVARTSPAGGSLAVPGTQVTIYVSDGSQNNGNNGNNRGRGRTGGGVFPFPTPAG